MSVGFILKYTAEVLESNSQAEFFSTDSDKDDSAKRASTSM